MSTLSCPKHSTQIGALNADIPGCGLEECSARYQDNYSTIQDCQTGCNNNANCLSYSWAPLNGDRDHKTKTVCTLYDSDIPTSIWSPLQIMCKPQTTNVFPTTIPTNIPTHNPTITPTNNPTSMPTIFPTIHPIDSKTFIQNTYDTQTIYHYHIHHQHPTLYIMIGLFGGLILLFICICMLCIWCLYLWKQKRNNKIGMHKINDNDNELQNKMDTISISTKSLTILNEHHYYNNTLELTEDVNAITIHGDEGEETSATIYDDSDNDSDNTDFDKMYELPIGIKSHKTKKYCVDSDYLDGDHDNTNLLSSLDDEQNVISL